jgi:SpoVK/Ycf46/Vps4 family AAA+-type ATPase
MEADIFSLLDSAPAPAPEIDRSGEVIAEASGEPATVEIEGELAQAAALLAIRFLQSGLGRRLILPNGSIRDADVLDLVGINLDDVSEASRKREIFHQGMAIQRVWLESQPRPLLDCIDRNLVEIGTRLALPPAALEVLRMGVLTHHVPGLMDIWRLTRRNCLEEFSQMTSRALELPMIEVRQALSRSSSLRRAGLLHAIMCWDDPSSCLAMDAAVADVFASENMDTQALLNAVVRPSDPPKLGLGDFGHLACEVETATTYLQNAVRLGMRGVNVLLHGEPGVGKTELAKVLAAAASLHLHEVPTEDRDGDSLGKAQRLGSFMTCQRLLADGERQAILFDEIEDVFPVEGSSLAHMGRTSNEVPKGYFNHLLETTPVPTFWISNAIFQIDPAFIRRFDLVIKVTQLPQRDRERLLHSALAGVALPTGAIPAAASIAALSPAVIDSTAGVLRLIAGSNPDANLTLLKGLVRSTLSAMGHSEDWPTGTQTTAYRLDWLNPSYPLQPLIDGLARSGRGRVCIYGAPGTGKTAFAHHLGCVLGRRLIIRRVSDIQSKWAGETEKRIAAMFEEATREESILLLDEADSFLSQRQDMHQQWQVTQVNEMLTQMEAFNGIFIASTNLAERLDDASLRRFDFKLRFDPPTPAQRRDMVIETQRQLCGQDCYPAELAFDPALIGEIDRLHELTPGDIAAARRQCEITASRPSLPEWIALLRGEVRAKQRGRSAPIGFVV